jgi:uncharacterized membrane protein YphA (DoxX/SURF4 family)
MNIQCMLRHRAVPFLALLGLMLMPLPVLAHEKWFVEKPEGHPLQPERLLNPFTLIAIVLAFALVGALVIIRRFAGGDNLFPRVSFLRRFDPSAPVVIAIQTAISIIWMAVNLRLFAPNLVLPGGFFAYLVAASQLAVAFSFISGMLVRWAAGLLLSLVVVTGILFGPVAMLEQSIFAGIAVYMALMGRGLIDPEDPDYDVHPLNRYRPLAPSILRVLAALSIVVLAFSEKLLNPELGVAFLQEYPHFNIPRQLGFTWFTDTYFVLAAGVAELAIGLALMSGVLPRLVIFGMFVPFNLTIPFLPATELLGHLPIFAVMYVLLFHQPMLRSDAPEGANATQVALQPIAAQQSVIK